MYMRSTCIVRIIIVACVTDYVMTQDTLMTSYIYHMRTRLATNG